LEQGLGELTPAQQLRLHQTAALRRAMPAVAAALAKARGLEDLTGGRRPNEWPSPLLLNLPFDDIQQTRAVAHLLALHAQLQAQDGPADDALTTCRQILATARAAQTDPMLISGLVCIAIRAIAVGKLERVLAQSEPSDAALAKAQRDLEAEAARPMFLDMLRGERALVEDFVRAVDEGRMTREQADQFGGGVQKVTGYATIDRWLHRLRGGGWRKRAAAATLRYQTALIEIVKQSPDALHDRSAGVAALHAGLPRAVREWIPALDKATEADRRSQAMLRSAIAAVAAERFRRARGRWPESIAELVPAYLAAVPRDPYDGRPLRLRRLADGLVIYSVGSDLADDGGAVRFDPRAPAMPKDTGFQLWDPARRRQPPPPPAAP
jgi:hypothetical protein